MLTADLEKQQSLERKQIKGGLDKIRSDTKKLIAKDYASATVFGSASIDTLLPNIIKAINIKKEERKKTAKGGAGHLMELLPFIFDIDSESQAAITAKLTFDKVFSPKKKSDQLTNIVKTIGQGLEAESQMRYYERVAPGLFNILKKNYWHQAKGTEYKRKSMQSLFHNKDIVQWKPWGQFQQIQIGTWLLDCFCEASGWFNKFKKIEGNRQTWLIVPTEAFLIHAEEIKRITELFSPQSLPMLIPPRDWHEFADGGYYLNELINCHEMVRRGVPYVIQERKIYDFLNLIQKVKYKLNTFTVEIAEELDERGIEVGKFRPIIHHPDPPKPVDIDTNETARKEWRKKKAIFHNKNKNEFRASCRTRMTMNVVKQFKDVDYYIPFSFDYRGRVYPIPSFLTPQDTDFGKSLIRFSDETEITEEGKKWLAFQVSTTVGLDKATMEDRLAWVTVEENIQRIIRVATDPINNIGDWETADEPWQFCAACEEYYAVVIAGTRTTTGLPVATDATCSGLQILAGLARDKSTA